MTHNHFTPGDRVMRIAPWTGDSPEVCIPIEVGAVHFVTEVLDSLMAFAADVVLLEDPAMWGGQYVRLDHPFFTGSDGRPQGWIHANSLRLLAGKDVVDVVRFEYYSETQVMTSEQWMKIGETK